MPWREVEIEQTEFLKNDYFFAEKQYGPFDSYPLKNNDQIQQIPKALSKKYHRRGIGRLYP
jgi:hypothetical protein